MLVETIVFNRYICFKSNIIINQRNSKVNRENTLFCLVLLCGTKTGILYHNEKKSNEFFETMSCRRAYQTNGNARFRRYQRKRNMRTSGRG